MTMTRKISITANIVAFVVWAVVIDFSIVKHATCASRCSLRQKVTDALKMFPDQTVLCVSKTFTIRAFRAIFLLAVIFCIAPALSSFSRADITRARHVNRGEKIL
jgi:hypothetical protein